MRLALLAGAALLASGCASMVYSPANADLNDPEVSGCDRTAMEDSLVKSCRRLSEGASVKTGPPFFEVLRRTSLADPYKLSEKPSLAAQFFFELTPLGFFAPLFGYPPRETVYTGRVELASAKFEFRVKAGETLVKTAGSETVSITCRARACELTSTPRLP